MNEETVKQNQFENLESADGKLGKAAWAWLDALSQYEEDTDVDYLFNESRNLVPDITISKDFIRAWAKHKDRTPGQS